MGRPSIFTQETIDAICDRLAEGEPLAAICRDEGMPDPSTVWDWQQARPDVSQRIARAREAGFDAIAASCLEIADDSRNDYIQKLAEGGDERAEESRSNGEAIQRSKLRVDTRLKLLAKWDPKRYGERVELAGAGGGALIPARIEIVAVEPKKVSE